MKKIYLLLFPIILLFGIFTAAKAQNNNRNDTYYPLVQEGKIWSVLTREGASPWNYKFGTTQMALFGDTLIDDVLYKKMYVSQKEFPKFPQDWTLQNFMREDEDKKVWYKKCSGSEEKLYYDFSLKIGDTLPENLAYGIPEKVIVEDITSEIMQNGQERKVWHLTYYNCYYDFSTDTLICNATSYSETWIEGIGSNFGVLEPVSATYVGAVTYLLCVHKNEELVFNDNEWDGVCYKTGSTSINAYENQITIYPNPTKDRLHIEMMPSLHINAISLINIQGQIVRSYKPNTTQLDVSGIAEGIYFIKISSSEGYIIKKVLIEKQ